MTKQKSTSRGAPPRDNRADQDDRDDQSQTPALYKPSAARLPWNPRLENEFGDMGLVQSNWRFIVENLYPAAETPESIHMVWSYCRARKLDPFKKPCHIVPVYNSKLERSVDTVWPGIADLRTTAARTGAYAGKDRVEFGPLVTRTFEGTRRVYRPKPQRGYDEYPESVEVTFPEWAQVTVYRMVQGHRVAFHGDPVFWLETYARVNRWSEIPNEMWRRRGAGQLAKCAEAGSLRQAFPEELGSDYALEEMEGQILREGPRDDPPEPAAPRTMTLLPVATQPEPEPQPGSKKTTGAASSGSKAGAGPKGSMQRDDTDASDTNPDLAGADSSAEDPLVQWDHLLTGLEEAVASEMPGFRAELINEKRALLDQIGEEGPDALKARAADLLDIADNDGNAS